MRYEKLYSKYKGYKASDGVKAGIICGYWDNGIIMSTLNGWSLSMLPSSGYIENPDVKLRYWSVAEEIIDKNSQPMETILEFQSNDAELYIKKYFPDLSDDDTDIYINIFIAGANSIKS